MRHNFHAFTHAVEYYQGRLKGKIENRLLFCVLNLKNKKAFFSLAPLSRAVHNLKGDMHIQVIDGKSENFEIIKDIWYVYDDYKKGLKTRKVKALIDFVRAVNKRTNTRSFFQIFKRPDIMLIAEDNGFSGTMDMEYKPEWHKRYRWSELLETAKTIWKDGFSLNKKDFVAISNVLVPSEKQTELPLSDYLDSFSMAYAMAITAKKFRANVGIVATTDRFSILAKAVRTAELITTIRGCELEKEIDEEVFQKYKIFSEILKIDKMKFTTAAFGIHAKGYYGRHFFGETIGYPTLNKKSRWTTPGQLMLKDRYSPQSRLETRDPMMRYAITESLPIDIFIDTCNINYENLRKRSEKIRDIFNSCNYIRVVGKEINGYKTDFRVELFENNVRNEFTANDCNVTTIVDQEAFEKTGENYGSFANFPSGETFTTPAGMRGVMIGDVVINIDRSYKIQEGKPIIVEFDERGYRVIKSPSYLLKIMRKEKKEAREKLKHYEKTESLPKDIIDIYKKNFNNVGEFAVNTNPKAKLCDYLIVNEKIAEMIHVALGSGFLPQRKTMYHWDIVVNSPMQKLDVYGVDKNKKVHWVIKKGRFVV